MGEETKGTPYADALWKKPTIQFCQRLQDIDPNGNLELPADEKEAVAKMKELEDHIKRLDGLDSVASELEKKKKELMVLKKKFPQTHLHARDFAQYMESMKDIEEKRAMVEKQMKEQLAKEQESHAKLAPAAEEEEKNLREDTEMRLKAIDKQVSYQFTGQAAAIKASEDSIKAHIEQPKKW